MRTQTIGRILREPLLHFAAVGLLIFGAQGLYRAHRPKPSGAALDRQALAIAQAELTGELGRAPVPEELRLLEDKLVDDQLMFQEGIALGLNQNDAIVRRRIVQKMQFFAEDLGAGAEPSTEALSAFLAANADRYRRPERVTFSQRFFRGDRADAPEAAGQALVALQRGGHPSSDPLVLGDRFVGRTRQELEEQLGPELAAAVFSSPVGKWSGPLRSTFGVHLVRVESLQPAELPALADILPRLKGDLLEERRAQARAEMLRKLRKKYGVAGEPASTQLLAPALASEESR